MNKQLRLALAFALTLLTFWQFCKIVTAKADVLMYPSPIEFEAATRVAWGEMRGGSDMEIAGVCDVMLNRMLYKFRGRNLEQVVHWSRQFSAYNVDDVNRAKLDRPTLTRWRSYKRVARICGTTIPGRLEGWLGDVTEGADHYWSGKREPAWSWRCGRVIDIGSTHFCRFRGRKVKNLARAVDDPIALLIRKVTP